MVYEHFEHKADVGIRGIGKTIEKAFEETAKALFDVEVNIKKIKVQKRVKVKVNATNFEELLVEWLNALLTQSSIHELVFSKFKVSIKEKDSQEEGNGQFFLVGFAWGEKLDPNKHEIKDEVKGATYSQLKVHYNKKNKKWIAQCVVDV